MDSKIERKGSCLCGAVRVVAKTTSSGISVCHCKMCRQWGGGPFFAAECESDANFEGFEHICIFKSSDWAERGFCRKCGTHLFYRLEQDGHYAIPVGLFEDSDDWTLAEQIFVDAKPSFYSFSEKTTDLTGEEAFARYSGE